MLNVTQSVDNYFRALAIFATKNEVSETNFGPKISVGISLFATTCSPSDEMGFLLFEFNTEFTHNELGKKMRSLTYYCLRTADYKFSHRFIH
jgi:hypothetical protein